MPNRSAPTKSLVLKVRRKSARLSTANSRTKVILRVGQERPPKEEDGTQIRVGAKKVHHDIDITIARSSARADTLECLLILENKGTERLIRHR